MFKCQRHRKMSMQTNNNNKKSQAQWLASEAD